MRLWAVIWQETTHFRDRGRLFLGVYDTLDKAISKANGCFGVEPYSVHAYEVDAVEDDDGNVLAIATYQLRKYTESRRHYECEIQEHALNGSW